MTPFVLLFEQPGITRLCCGRARRTAERSVVPEFDPGTSRLLFVLACFQVSPYCFRDDSSFKPPLQRLHSAEVSPGISLTHRAAEEHQLWLIGEVFYLGLGRRVDKTTESSFAIRLTI